MDHLLPRSQGGALIVPVEELALVHVGCNSIRGNRTRTDRAGSRPIAAIELGEEAAPRPVSYRKVKSTNGKRETEMQK